jgi:hypothetical protein
MTLFGTSPPNRHPTPVSAFNTSLHQRGCSWPPLLSSCQVVKQGLVHELENVKLIVLSDAGGAFGAGFETYASHLMVSEAGARGDAGGLWFHASALHPQQRAETLTTSLHAGAHALRRQRRPQLPRPLRQTPVTRPQPRRLVEGATTEEGDHQATMKDARLHHTI